MKHLYVLTNSTSEKDQYVEMLSNLAVEIKTLEQNDSIVSIEILFGKFFKDLVFSNGELLIQKKYVI